MSSMMIKRSSGLDGVSCPGTGVTHIPQTADTKSTSSLNIDPAFAIGVGGRRVHPTRPRCAVVEVSAVADHEFHELAVEVTEEPLAAAGMAVMNEDVFIVADRPEIGAGSVVTNQPVTGALKELMQVFPVREIL